MIVTFNQIAYFKPETTARRLKSYYSSGNYRPEVFLSYLRSINVVATLCPTVSKLSIPLYTKEVRELFFTHRDKPEVIKYLWLFRRFFTKEECCLLLKGSVLEPDLMTTNATSSTKLVPFPIQMEAKRSRFRLISGKTRADFRSFSVEYSENSVKTVDIEAGFRYFCTNEKPTTLKWVMNMKDNSAIFGLLLL